MAVDLPLARAVQGMSASQTISQVPTASTGHNETKADCGRISLPREELEDIVLAKLQLTARCADVREVAIFGAAGLRPEATWIVASFLPGSLDAERELETVRNVERDLQSKYDMMLGS